MFVVTNRDLLENSRTSAAFGAGFNRKGPHELRMAEIGRARGRWKVRVLPDVLDDELKAEVGIDDEGEVFASRYVAERIRQRLRRARTRRHAILYVHGFNNDIDDVLEQGWALERAYRAEVVAFSWPARGGGAAGTLSYRRDKKVARLSVGALDRVIGKMHHYLQEFNLEIRDLLHAEAMVAHPHSPIERDRFVARRSEEECPFRVSALFHSMGNYLFKNALQSPIFESRELVFDNVVLAAADTNNENHHEWVDQIECRGQIYVTINADDYALQASRLKFGEAQGARLGHYRRGLDADRAIYVDCTDARGVGRSHSYFLGEPVAENRRLKAFFKEALHGGRPHEHLQFDVADNLYRF